ncbi:MAG TPA: hypothetical protein VFU49_05760 [Ktedonobacteraceae bacterium]|nr:hypothetical protein [Ktedonobacteraceae bacterium]
MSCGYKRVDDFWPSQTSRPLEIPARHGHQARFTHVHLAFGQMTLLPSRNDPRTCKESLDVWVIRVWKEQAPEGEKPNLIGFNPRP